MKSTFIFYTAVAVALSFFVVLTSAALNPLTDDAYKSLWDQFRQKFPRTYASSQEEDTRFKNFKVNVDYIREHNDNTNKTFTVGMNEFGDLTLDEWSERYKGFISPPSNTPITHPPPADFKSIVNATSVDWRTAGVVTPVKNQGTCGSCWAWASASAIESAWAINRGELNELSVQQFVDCNRRNQGCRGGWMTVAYDYAIANKGICAAAGYPYRGRQGRCERCNPIATISTYIDLRGLGDEGLIKGLNVGPVTVAVQSNSRGFMFYRSGVINGQCGRSLDHAITAVGYGRDEALGMDYYLVKNSWGTGWGEDGYVRIQRGRNMCGINDMASFPLVKGLGDTPAGAAAAAAAGNTAARAN